ncbi:hypothetical protein J2W30_003384 [Variovorax boronicumulans]|uniref:polysaccharide deacetylase n=1 Tax=Variovorax boronicumulans TaxID=436515 RepID=UPI00278AC1E8|nr:polysaccharide deacetylase [Variovorax boronicumulans]MDQ0035616.1 hypothetical protein [Variovorax boronicumulans]
MASTNEERKPAPRLGFEDICAQFNVPARKGARVNFQGQPGTVTTARGLMVRVRLDGMSWSRPYAPDELEWLDEQSKAMEDGACDTCDAHRPQG